jgi:hypothetical protein
MFADNLHGLLEKGRNIAKDLGSTEVLRLEIMHLQSQSETLIARLAVLYMSLPDSDDVIARFESASIQEIVDKIEQVCTQKDSKEKELQLQEKMPCSTVQHTSL